MPICRPTINSPAAYACSCLIGNCSALSQCCGVSDKGGKETCEWWVNCIKWTAECCSCKQRIGAFLQIISCWYLYLISTIEKLFFMLKCKKVYVIQCSVVVCGQDINVHAFPLFSFRSGKTKNKWKHKLFFLLGNFFFPCIPLSGGKWVHAGQHAHL